MEGRLRMGVIGCGVMGKKHCDAINKSELMELAAIAEIREDVLKSAAEEYKPSKAYASSDMLAEDPEVDAAVIAMPTGVRTPIAMKCFENGKHVMLEKPVGMNAKEVKDMIAASSGLTVGCLSSRFRVHPSAKAAADFLAGGRCGDIRLVRVRAVRPDSGPPSSPPPPWRLNKELNGGGIFVNWGCYDLDYVLGITGWKLEPELVLARAWEVSPVLSSRAAPGSDAETHLTALIKCANGAAINYERGEFMPAEEENAWQVAGTKGTLNLRMTGNGQRKIVFYEGFSDRAVEPEIVWEHTGDDAFVGTVGALDDFALAVKNKTKPRTGLEESLLLQKITDAVYESVETGKAVEIE